jgi:polyhydroxyalkanoate synthesis regulator phasin
MTETIQNALILTLALITIVSLLVLKRSVRKFTADIEARVSGLEKDLVSIQNAFGEQAARNIEEINQKSRQVKEEIKAALCTSVDSVMKKVAANDSGQNCRFDSLEARISQLQEDLKREAAKPVRQEVVPQAKPDLKEMVAPAKPKPAPVDDANAKARRLARLIVSDIALYSRKNVEEGVRNGNFNELLAHDIKEARSLYARRVPEEIRNGTTYLDEAFTELIERTKQELSL